VLALSDLVFDPVTGLLPVTPLTALLAFVTAVVAVSTTP